MAEAQSRYGDVLSAVGREAEGQKYIDDALKLAIELKNDTVIAEALDALGDSHFYAGDYASARQQYERALQTANKAALREQIVFTKLNLAKVDVAQGHFQAAAPVLKKLIQDADSMGLKAQSVEASVYLGEALLATKQVDAARQELDTAVGRAEKLGLRVEQARGSSCWVMPARLAVSRRRRFLIIAKPCRYWNRSAKKRVRLEYWSGPTSKTSTATPLNPIRVAPKRLLRNSRGNPARL